MPLLQPGLTPKSQLRTKLAYRLVVYTRPPPDLCGLSDPSSTLVGGRGFAGWPLTTQPDASLPSKSRTYPCCLSAAVSSLSAPREAARTVAADRTARPAVRRMV